jgi:hypothetical protein
MMEPFSFEVWRDLMEAWAARKPEAIEQVNRLLASAGLTMDAFMLELFCDNLHAVECIERMIAKAEARRNDALFEIERHRSTFAFTLRRTVQQVEAEHQAVVANSAERAPRDQRSQAHGKSRQRAGQYRPEDRAGPRSRSAKRISARLEPARLFRSSARAGVEALAREIAGTDDRAEIQELARRVAEAQVDRRRVRYARHRLLSNAFGNP